MSVKKRYTSVISSSLLFGLLSLSAQAQIVPHLYDVSVESSDRTEKSRDQLFEKGLEEVIARVSGSKKVLEDEKIKEALAKPGKFVHQFSYNGGQLKANFNEKLVNQLLNQADYHVWGPNRPTVAVWLAIESQGKRRLVGSESDPSIHQYLQHLASSSGLPMILPILDLQDLAQVTVTDVWGQFPSVLKQASERYDADGILVGRLIERGQGNEKRWESKWQLVVDEISANWETTGQHLNEALSFGIEGMSQELAQVYGVKAGSDNKGFLVGVRDINNLQDYAKAMAYLNNLDPVAKVEVKAINPNSVVFYVVPKSGGKNTLTQAIDLDRNLATLAARDAEFKDMDMTYRWVR